MASPEDTTHANNLEYTLKELRREVREREQQLSRLRASQEDVILSPIAQVQVITAALDKVTDAEPFVPIPGSLLPSLIALRKTHATITESNALVEEQAKSQEAQDKRLEADRAALKDQKLIHEALTARIASLQEELSSNADVTLGDAVSAKREELRQKAKDYSRRKRQLMIELLAFMERELAPLLVAEEMGGPVVGDLMDVDANDLAAGFTAQGRLRKTGKGDAGREKGQRRIDEIWGRDGEGGGRRPAADNQRRRPLNDVEAAAEEMRWLTEQLLNKMTDAAGNTEDSYVNIGRESAAVRFLIRSKVAQYHPRDISRIKLIDFGRELEE
ncbi:Centromere protein Cenp-K [Cordyceps fumosorosea ARSEF 2679]|uniref:Centromere protein Cenp-K n=1 Tax=Cordyceps fumosorosea (strain ARSEF 2679) TaxID=1081104 RepID=A0A168E7J8_CORFA|nr:Centromere protein Cenp-K [Cordyceps fumosorosea ARSEF 2679]OAA73467.1 Centromere protein Cenp-K [Cordyceps fumosorosea ARSEF 2679]